MFNDYAIKIKQTTNKVLSYDDVFEIPDIGVLNKIKLRIIQEMIQVERPRSWSTENLNKIIRDM
jgi:hypothetical protein